MLKGVCLENEKGNYIDELIKLVHQLRSQIWLKDCCGGVLEYLYTKQAAIADIKMQRTHLVILGAGASLAAFPNGDRNGLRLPLMNNLVEVVGLSPVFLKYGIKNVNQNFEIMYSSIADDASLSNLRKEIEERILQYFFEMELPPEPTIYDHLVLGLREKDVIATFNWDPFLWQALRRHYTKAPLPRAIYLHGNVAVGYCLEGKSIGPVGALCSCSGKEYLPSKLLYPVNKKNYNSDPFISQMWKEMNAAIKNAFMITIFGYGAPQSDVEAIELFKNAWGDIAERQFEEIEIIDIRSQDELEEIWSPFIHTHHFRVTTNFFESQIAKYPRRTLEALWANLMEAQFTEDFPLKKEMSFDEIFKHIEPFIKIERKN